MKGRGFTEICPSIYVLSVINRFIFGHWVLIYFIIQSLLEKRNKTYLVFLLSERVCRLPPCLFFQSRSDSYANQSYEISLLSIHFVVKLNWNSFSVCLRGVVSKWHQMTSRNVLLLTSLSCYITLRFIKIEMRCLFSQWRCALFLSSKWTSYLCDRFTKQLFRVIAL